MTRNVVDILPQAADEAREARNYYLSKSAVVEEAFRREVERAIDLIKEHPETWPGYVHGTRRFPYSLVYKTDGTYCLIVAVAHAKRKPGYWGSRVR